MIRRVFDIYVDQAPVLLPASAVVFVITGILTAPASTQSAWNDCWSQTAMGKKFGSLGIPVAMTSLAFAIGLVEVDQAGAFEHVDDDLAQGEAARVVAHRIDARREGREVGAALAGQRADALPEAAAARARRKSSCGRSRIRWSLV